MTTREALEIKEKEDHTILYEKYWHPFSERNGWISKLQISAFAKRLTRLRGRQFKVAVVNILNMDGDTHDRGRASIT